MDKECGHCIRAEGDDIPGTVEAVLGEMGGTNGRAEPRVPVRTTDSLHPLSKQGGVVKRKPEWGRVNQKVIFNIPSVCDLCSFNQGTVHPYLWKVRPKPLSTGPQQLVQL